MSMITLKLIAYEQKDVVFLCLTLLWFGLNVYWLIAGGYCVTKFDLVVAVLFVLAGAGMVYNGC